MSFHSPTLPATQTGAGVLSSLAVTCQTTGSWGEGPGRFQTYPRTPLNLSRGDHDGRVNHRLAEPASLSLAIPVCFQPGPEMCRAEALGRRCPSTTGPQHQAEQARVPTPPRTGSVCGPGLQFTRHVGSVCSVTPLLTQLNSSTKAAVASGEFLKGNRKSSPQRQNGSWWAGSCQGQVKGGDFEKPAHVTSGEN